MEDYYQLAKDRHETLIINGQWL